MSDLFMKVVDGAAVGVPVTKPSSIVLDSGHKVGCAHWGNDELASVGGLYPVVDYDPATHIATGGGVFDSAAKKVTPNKAPIPVAEINDRKKAGIRDEAERRLIMGILVGGHPFKCDDVSVGRLFNMLQLALSTEAGGGSWSQSFMTAAGEKITLTASAQVKVLYEAAAGYAGQVLEESVGLQEALPDDFTLDAHWPAVTSIAL